MIRYSPYFSRLQPRAACERATSLCRCLGVSVPAVDAVGDQRSTSCGCATHQLPSIVEKNGGCTSSISASSLFSHRRLRQRRREIRRARDPNTVCRHRRRQGGSASESERSSATAQVPNQRGSRTQLFRVERVLRVWVLVQLGGQLPGAMPHPHTPALEHTRHGLVSPRCGRRQIGPGRRRHRCVQQQDVGDDPRCAVFGDDTTVTTFVTMTIMWDPGSILEASTADDVNGRRRGFDARRGTHIVDKVLSSASASQADNTVTTNRTVRGIHENLCEG